MVLHLLLPNSPPIQTTSTKSTPPFITKFCPGPVCSHSWQQCKKDSTRTGAKDARTRTAKNTNTNIPIFDIPHKLVINTTTARSKQPTHDRKSRLNIRRCAEDFCSRDFPNERAANKCSYTLRLMKVVSQHTSWCNSHAQTTLSLAELAHGGRQ
jgi:hypothetical protein